MEMYFYRAQCDIIIIVWQNMAFKGCPGFNSAGKLIQPLLFIIKYNFMSLLHKNYMSNFICIMKTLQLIRKIILQDLATCKFIRYVFEVESLLPCGLLITVWFTSIDCSNYRHLKKVFLMTLSHNNCPMLSFQAMSAFQ